MDILALLAKTTEIGILLLKVRTFRKGSKYQKDDGHSSAAFLDVVSLCKSDARYFSEKCALQS